MFTCKSAFVYMIVNYFCKRNHWFSSFTNYLKSETSTLLSKSKEKWSYVLYLSSKKGWRMLQSLMLTFCLIFWTQIFLSILIFDFKPRSLCEKNVKFHHIGEWSSHDELRHPRQKKCRLSEIMLSWKNFESVTFVLTKTC